jgi:hypothetical protein
MSKTRGEQAMSEVFEHPFRPVELSDATLTSLPVQEMAQQLMTEKAFQTSGRNALTLIRDKNITVVLTVLKAGAILQDHHAPVPVTLLPSRNQFDLPMIARESGIDCGEGVR